MKTLEKMINKTLEETINKIIHTEVEKAVEDALTQFEITPKQRFFNKNMADQEFKNLLKTVKQRKEKPAINTEPKEILTRVADNAIMARNLETRTYTIYKSDDKKVRIREPYTNHFVEY